MPGGLKHRCQQQAQHHQEQQVAATSVLDEWCNHRHVGTVQPVLRFGGHVLQCGPLRERLGGFTGEPAVGSPGHHHVGDYQRSNHCDRHVERDGTHEWPHHAGDESHRDKRQDDRDGGDIGGVADLVGGGDQRFLEVLAAAVVHVSVDVFHYHNGRIHQQTQGQYQRE